MRYIDSPAPIQLQDTAGNPFKDGAGQDIKPLSFADFVRVALLCDPSWMQGSAAVRSSLKIEEAVKSDGPIALEDADWEKLKKVCEAPQPQQMVGVFGGYTAAAMRQLYPFLGCILEAKDTPPPKAESEPEKDAA